MKKLLLGTALIVSLNSVSAGYLSASSLYNSAAQIFTSAQTIQDNIRENAPNTYSLLTKKSTVVYGLALYGVSGLPVVGAIVGPTVVKSIVFALFCGTIEYKTPKIIKKGIGFGVNLIGRLISLVNIRQV